MPVAVTIEPAASAPLNPPRKRWTRAECEVLERSGLLVNEHLELIDGELINKMGKNRPHVNSIVLLIEWLSGVFGARFVIPESPIDVAPADNPTNEPEPDLIVTRLPIQAFQTANPEPKDVALLVEISDTTRAFDLSVKAALYARAGIVEYWVLDINGRRMVVHREPEAGVYRSVIAYGEEESVTPLAAPSAALRVGDVLLPN